MAFNGSGTFVRSHNWVTDKTNVVPVTASRMDTECDGFATGLSTALCKDGQTTATARIPFALGVSSMDGSVSSASFAHVSDLNTGLYFPAADQWGLTAGGTGTLTSTATALTGGSGVTLTLSGALTVSSGGAIVTGNSTVTGTLGVSGNFAVATNKFTVAAASGDTVVAGTLGITGTTTAAAINATAIAGTTGTFSGAVSGTTITGSGAVSGATAAGAMVATQAEQETGSATDKLVTPGRQHFHPGAAKAWGKFAGASGVVAASYNVTGVSHDATGNYTVTIANDFSSAEYSIVVTVFHAALAVTHQVIAQAAGSFQISTNRSDTQANLDPTAIMFVCYGDL